MPMLGRRCRRAGLHPGDAPIWRVPPWTQASARHPFFIRWGTAILSADRRPALKRLSRKAKKLARVAGLFPYYQEQRSAAAEARWRFIESKLAPSDRNLLDIGCNVGFFTARAAARGMLAFGIEPLEEAVARAQRSHREQPRVAFMWLAMGPDHVESMPAFDVTLCLSMHHYWYRAHGPEICWRMLGGLANKSGKLFFEPASAHRRYGEARPDFEENDRDSIRDYVERNFKALFGSSKSIELLGSTPSLKDEAFRLMFLVQ